MKYVIIGNGVAGTGAAISVRKNDPLGEITLISNSKYKLYSRPRLIDYMAGRASMKDIIIYSDEFYQKQNINCILNTHISKISPEKHSVLDNNGIKYYYDRLLLATGSQAFRLPINGVEKKGVFTVRTALDCDRVLSYCRDLPDIVVVGGGVLGLEAADCFRILGKNISVIEVSPWLLPKQLDQEGGNHLLGMLQKRGIGFFINETVVKIEGKEKVERILLESGRTIKADAVIISAGVRPNKILAEEANLNINRGVIVSDFLETSLEDIYAGGDLTEHQGKLCGLWSVAKHQGTVAGANMAGKTTKYHGIHSSTTLKVSGISLFSAGDFNREDAEILSSQNGNLYKKFLIKDNQLIGAIVLGDAHAAKIANRIYAGKERLDKLEEIV